MSTLQRPRCMLSFVWPNHLLTAVGLQNVPFLLKLVTGTALHIPATSSQRMLPESLKRTTCSCANVHVVLHKSALKEQHIIPPGPFV